MGREREKKWEMENGEEVHCLPVKAPLVGNATTVRQFSEIDFIS